MRKINHTPGYTLLFLLFLFLIFFFICLIGSYNWSSVFLYIYIFFTSYFLHICVLIFLTREWKQTNQVGAPPEVVARLEEACASEEAMGRSATSCVGEDPALDQFMEAYCEMLTKYEQELTKPFKEAMLFLSRIECQFKALTVAPSDSGDPSLQPLFSSLPTP